ncbi:MAG: hypothetical protein Q8T11_03700 [Elusimicrobiota bacterium]|nr:hypothetical protein [Elusimicrobiota bacterium]
MNVAMGAAMIMAFASLFCVILAAHFLRMGAMTGVVVCLALPIVAVLTRARWALRALQAVLLLGSVSWIVTAWHIGAARQAAGEPWLRMAVILGTVAALSALAAGLLSRRSVLARFPAAPVAPTDA